VNLTPEKIIFYRKNPTIAARDLLQLRLHWTQRQMVKVAFRTQNVCWLACRSLGKSWLLAVFLCLKCILFKNMKCGVFASSYEQACFVFEKLQQLWDDSPFLQSVTKGPPKVTKDEAILRFTTGSFIRATPVRRGARYNVVAIDEYRDLMPETLAVIKPYLLAKHATEKNQMIISSTATWQTNHFYAKYKEFEEQVRKGNTNYAITSFDIDDALSGDFTFIDKDVVDSLKNELLLEEIEQELYCRFSNLRDGFFGATLIQACEATYDPEMSCDKSLVYLGLDIGRVKGGDNSAFTLCKIVPGKGVMIIRVKILNGATMPEQRIVLGRLVRDYNVSKIIMDNEKLGYALRDEMEKPVLDDETNEILPPLVLEEDYSTPDALRIVKGQNFANKTEMWERIWDVKKAMQDKMLFLPKDKYRILLNTEELGRLSDEDRELVNEFHEIAQLKREMSNMEVKQTESASALSLVPGSGAKIKDDRFYSMILSSSEAIRDYKDMLNIDTSGSTIYWG
jgi:predicted metallopeptidase